MKKSVIFRFVRTMIRMLMMLGLVKVFLLLSKKRRPIHSKPSTPGIYRPQIENAKNHQSSILGRAARLVGFLAAALTLALAYGAIAYPAHLPPWGIPVLSADFGSTSDDSAEELSNAWSLAEFLASHHGKIVHLKVSIFGDWMNPHTQTVDSYIKLRVYRDDRGLRDLNIRMLCNEAPFKFVNDCNDIDLRVRAKFGPGQNTDYGNFIANTAVLSVIDGFYRVVFEAAGTGGFSFQIIPVEPLD